MNFRVRYRHTAFLELAITLRDRTYNEVINGRHAELESVDNYLLQSESVGLEIIMITTA